MTKQCMLAAVAVLAASASASAGLVAGWTMTTAIPAATTGSNYTYGAADQGDAAAGTSLSAFHSLAATTWSTPSGNGSQYSFSSNNWSVGDYYQISVSTVGFSDIHLAWDQTRSSTGPSSFRVDMSTDGGANFSTILASYSIIQAGLAGTNTLSWSTAGAVQSAFTTTIASIAGADNQASVIFRFVNLSTVATGGTNRIDNIIVNSGPIPAPGAIALLGLAGLAARRRR
jgi:MYXO-CTERM domain-containing protein